MFRSLALVCTLVATTDAQTSLKRLDQTVGEVTETDVDSKIGFL
jgi:hypothetical protein